MKISPILAALGGGVAGLGLSQGGAGGALSTISPLLALLMQFKKKKGDKDDDSAPANPGPINVTQSPLMRAMPMLPPGMAQPPFGNGLPPGRY